MEPPEWLTPAVEVEMKLPLVILLAVLSSACVQVRVYDCTGTVSAYGVHDEYTPCDVVPLGIRG